MKGSVKSLFFLVIFVTITSLSSCTGMLAESSVESFNAIVKQDIESAQVRTYIDRDNTIVLRTDGASRDYYKYPIVHFSYKIDIQSPISKGSADVHLRLLDSSGFQICQKSIGHVVGGYTGILKGQEKVYQSSYLKITNAEIVVYALPENV